VPQTRAYVASHFALELEKDAIGFVKSVEGGNLKADVLTYQMGHSQAVWRQMGAPKYDDITVQVGMGMSPKFYDWINGFFNRTVVRKSGAIIGADFNYKERTRRNFEGALISELTIPTLDGSSKEAAYMTVKLSPENITFIAVTGDDKMKTPTSLKQPNKLWLTSNFRFKLDGYEDACNRVQKIDSFTIKQKILEYPSGGRRFPSKMPGRLEYPNIVVYIPEVDARPFIDYLKDKMVDGDKDSDGALTGSIEFIGSDKKTLCTINLTGADIMGYEVEKFDATADAMARVKISLQVEAMEFDYESDATG
jgi:phage tail-like protein